MRHLLVGVLCVGLGCAGRSRSGFVIPPQPGLTRSCPYAPRGSEARLRLVILSELGDTLRSPRIRLTGKTWTGVAQPTLELDAPSPAGVYELGSLLVGEYVLSVRDNGRQTAHIRIKYCDSSLLQLEAVLRPTDPAEAP